MEITFYDGFYEVFVAHVSRDNKKFDAEIVMVLLYCD